MEWLEKRAPNGYRLARGKGTREVLNMIALRNGWLAPFVCFSILFSLVSWPSHAQWFQTQQYESYRDYRSTMLAEGWKPNVNYGLRDKSGKPLYRFPEVLCGPRICNAKWRDKKGKEATIRLIRSDGAQDYRVAPQ
jgi:hypothetical protein